MLREVLRVLGEALTLSPQLFSQVSERPFAILFSAVAVGILASVSTMLGHVAVLSLNRVRRWRLLSSLVLSFLIVAVLKVVEIAITWAVASMVFRRPAPFVPLLVVALLSTAPLVFSFITATPYLGLTFGRVLEAWSYLIVIVGVSNAFHVSIAWAFGLTLAGWLVVQITSRVGQRPLGWIMSRMWSLATGRPTMVTSRDILAGTPLIPVSHPSDEVASR